MFETLGWIGTALCLVGAYLTTGNKHRLQGFITFIIADCLLVGIQIHNGIWNQVALMAAFVVINIRGIAIARQTKEIQNTTYHKTTTDSKNFSY